MKHRRTSGVLACAFLLLPVTHMRCSSILAPRPRTAPTAQLLKAVAAFNSKLPYGSVIVDESAAYYLHDFIMNGMTADVLGTEIGAAFFLSQAAQKEFSAYVE